MDPGLLDETFYTPQPSMPTAPCSRPPTWAPCPSCVGTQCAGPECGQPPATTERAAHRTASGAYLLRPPSWESCPTCSISAVAACADRADPVPRQPLPHRAPQAPARVDHGVCGHGFETARCRCERGRRRRDFLPSPFFTEMPATTRPTTFTRSSYVTKPHGKSGGDACPQRHPTSPRAPHG